MTRENDFEPSERSAVILGAGRSASSPSGLALDVLLDRYAICRLDPTESLPDWAFEGAFSSVSRTAEELSIVCSERVVPEEVQCERGWRGIRVLGPLDFAIVGVISSIADPLRAAKIGLVAISTYDTDYIFVRADCLGRAVKVLREAGHAFYRSPSKSPEKRPPKQDDASPPSEKAAEEEAPAAEVASKPAEAPREQVTEPEHEAEREETPAERESKAEEPEAEAEEARESKAEEQEKRPEEKEKRPEEKEKKADRRQAQPAQPKAKRAPHAKDDEPPTGEEVEHEGLFTGAIPQHPVEITDRTFADLGLSSPILKTVKRVGFDHPTPIQAAVVPIALTGKDVIGLAETGSGKTAAFVLPLAERLTHGAGIRGLILCPTREIALQTKAFLDIFGRYHDLDTVAIIGGVKLGPQIDHLRKKPDIIVATPGRLVDHLERRNVRLDKIQALVLDEADHMLDLGFLPQIQAVLSRLPEKRHTMMFSATMPPPIDRLAQLFMDEPERIDFRPDGRAARGIEHRLYLVKEHDKKGCLYALLRQIEGSTLVFTRRRLDAEWLSRQLELAGFKVERIHSDRSQGQRVQALRGFKEGDHRVLVATDVAARGIDVPTIQHVINFGLPDQVEDYIHRAGRTARGSAGGIVSSITTWIEKPKVAEIENVLGQKVKRCQAPGVEAYVEVKRRKQVRRRRLL